MTPTTAPFDASAEFQRRAVGRIAERLVRIRLWVAPAVVAVGFFVAWADPAPWRRVVAGAVPLVLFAGSWYAADHLRRRGAGPYTLDANLGLNVVAQLLMVVATGGVDSPLAPTLLITSAIAALLTHRATAVAVALGLVAPTLAVIALLQRAGALPTLLPEALARAPYTASSPALLGWRAVALVFFLGGTVALGSLVRATLAGVLREVEGARAAQLDAHLEQNRALTTLTAEIAHEFKNPLATVKGLSALVARGLSGKEAERMAVLRREVERMERTLEEFLNFSRPLVPLALEPVDLAALARDVVALHEGMAAERGVRLALDAPDVARVKCDPRKVRQVLVNLLQNALDASPDAAAVTVTVARASGGGASVTVRDEGDGVAPDVGVRAFEAGVTTKARGSGLGLTVARALARQHGGDVTLRGAPSGGCVAELALPEEAPA